MHEDDPLLGVIYLPLNKLFAHRSQINGYFPLSGGIGYGRARISLVFRSIQFQAPKSLLGWDYGTVEVAPEIKSSDLPHDLQGMRIKVRTSLARGKLQSEGQGVWKSKRGHTLRLPVRKRYCTPLMVEFRTASAMLDHTPAFAVLWLKDIPDNEEQSIKLPVWKGNLKRAETNCLEEYGENVGSIEIKLTFWSGLSGYHSKLASKDINLGDVMEVLDTCADNDEMDFNDEDSKAESDGESSSNSDSASDSAGEITPTTRSGASSESLESNGKRGIAGQIKDYKAHRKQLNRRNRGLMQWKVSLKHHKRVQRVAEELVLTLLCYFQGPRTVQWMKHKAEHGQQHIASAFKYNERDTGIETEA